jgi:hypothetical protein
VVVLGLFDKAPYSFKNLIKGVFAARANGEPLGGYKYAVAFQQEEDERLGRTWSKQKMTLDHDTGLTQTDNYFGYVGEKGQKKKAHVAINENGDVVFVRIVGGEILYDSKKGIGHLPDDLDWNK